MFLNALQQKIITGKKEDQYEYVGLKSDHSASSSEITFKYRYVNIYFLPGVYR